LRPRSTSWGRRLIISFRPDRLRESLGLKRNLVLLLIAIVIIGAGEETWMRFVPKYLQSLGAAALVIGLYDGLKTLLGAVYAYPGGVVTDRWGHRKSLTAFFGTHVSPSSVYLSIRPTPAERSPSHRHRKCRPAAATRGLSART